MNSPGKGLGKVIEALERRRHALVLTHVKGKLLDIGCGANRLVRGHGDGVGVDVHPWENVDLVVENSAHLPFPDQSFDTVSLVACLNHIPNRQEVLTEAHRLLKDDGRLILTMIRPFLSMVWHKAVAGWDADQTERGMKAGEVWGFTTRQIGALLQGAGFEIKVHQRFVFWMNNLYVAEKRHGARPLAPNRCA